LQQAKPLSIEFEDNADSSPNFSCKTQGIRSNLPNLTLTINLGKFSISFYLKITLIFPLVDKSWEYQQNFPLPFSPQ